MKSALRNRIGSLDLLKGLVMVIMALDHARDYFHADAFLYDPTDPEKTNLLVFFTRWIAHFCAPAFCFLAGVSAFISGRRKTKGELSAFLLKRGLWLIFIEMTIVNFAWYFDIYFKTPGLLVIWSLGISMIFLAVLVHLPQSVILIFSLILIFGHNLLDNVHFEGSIFWAAIHDARVFEFADSVKLYVDYPIIPWIAVMSLGYYFGTFYDQSFDSNSRKKILKVLGFSSLLLFILLKWVNGYGDPVKWREYDSVLKTFVSFLNITKYPPSLMYLLATMGASFMFLAYTENAKGRVVNFFSAFGRVPFFYYIVHIFVIHSIAMIAAQLSGAGWQKMILDDWVISTSNLKGYGFSLWVVYLVWATVVILLYPICRKFYRYKMNHKEKWWLSYL